MVDIFSMQQRHVSIDQCTNFPMSNIRRLNNDAFFHIFFDYWLTENTPLRLQSKINSGLKYQSAPKKPPRNLGTERCYDFLSIFLLQNLISHFFTLKGLSTSNVLRAFKTRHLSDGQSITVSMYVKTKKKNQKWQDTMSTQQIKE